MRKIFAICFASLLLGTISRAQTATTSPSTAPAQQPAASQVVPSGQSQTPQQTTPRVPPGSIIPVQLMKTIDSKKARPGEEIEVKVTQDMKNGKGEVLIPKDTKVFGHITEAQKRTKEQKESELGITFERAALGGTDVAMPMSIQAVIVPPSQSTQNNEASGEGNSGPVSPPSGGQTPQSAPYARSGGMGPGGTQEVPTNSMPGTDWPSNNQTNNQSKTNTRQPITGNTQGVVGDPNLKLSTATTGSQPSVVSSEKNNVKLESGTVMLLRVTQ